VCIGDVGMSRIISIVIEIDDALPKELIDMLVKHISIKIIKQEAESKRRISSCVDKSK
jgi:hypothetical protein